MALPFFTSIATTAGGLFSKGGNDGGGFLSGLTSDGKGLFAGLFDRDTRRARRKTRRERRAARRTGKVLDKTVGAPAAKDTRLGTVIGSAGSWFQQNWKPIAIGAGVLFLLWLLFSPNPGLLRKGSAKGTRRSSGGSKARKSSSTSKRSSGSSGGKAGLPPVGATSWRTKSGKLIRGKEAVAKYRKQLQNLRKANRARK